MMRFRHWVATGIGLGVLISASAFAVADNPPATSAEQLPVACVKAGVTAKAECDALLAAQKAVADKAATEKANAEKAAAAQKAAVDKAAAAEAAQKAAADKAATEKVNAEKAAAAQKAAAEKAAADKAAAAQAAAAEAAQKAAADKAATEKINAEKAAAAQKAAADKAAADKAATEKANAEKAAAADKAAAAQAAAAEAAQKAAADKAATEKANAESATAAQKAVADKAAAAASLAASQKAAADKAVADKAAAAKAAADKAAADQAAAAKAAATVKQNQTPPGAPLPKDCVDAGLRTLADCDALHAIAAQKAKGKPEGVTPGTVPVPLAPARVAPAPNAAVPLAPAAGQLVPAAPTGDLPAEVTPARPAAVKPAEEPVAAAPALPDITEGLKAAAKSYNRGVAALSKAGVHAAAATKAQAEIDGAQSQIDVLCKSNKFDSAAQCLAQYAVRLSPLPAGAGAQPIATAPVQPVEVITALPKGVTQQDVAPLFDSAKDQKTGTGPAPGGQPPASTSLTPAQAAVASAPPPKSDKAAQSGLKPGKVVPIDQLKGKQIDVRAVPQVHVPQSVTIVNQTIVNNTNTTNTTNITNNTQNNNGSGVQQNTGQVTPANPIGLGVQVILQIGNQLIINSPGEDHRRISDRERDHTSYEQLPHDRYRETIERADGTRIVTIYNRNGDILRRSRFDRDGREYVLAYFDDQHEQDLLQWRDPGEDLPPLQLRIPARDYVLDAGGADQSQVQLFFAQPPVERVQRLYSIDEVKRSSRIRDMVRRLEIGDLHFDTGAATLSEDQVANLSNVAGAMLQLLGKNPAETFLIEGHTDAVGSDIANLQLSDARAATVAQILTDFYHIPPENLATQGYGKRYLKVQTDLPEPLNRRVVIRRITSLVTVASN
jgi:outer membrane protein OmpA-like peptidoglycan-associated protein